MTRLDLIVCWSLSPVGDRQSSGLWSLFAIDFMDGFNQIGDRLQICNYTQKTPNIVQNTTSKYTIAIATPTSPYPNYPRPTITLTPPKNCKSDYQTPRRKWEGGGSKRRWQSYARERDELCFISKRSLAKELTLAWGMSLVFSFWFQREPPRRVRNNVW